jgi:hypothetical protein
MRDPFAGYDQWKTASPDDEFPVHETVCRYCEKFEALGFKCCVTTKLECDCPVCQGMCECGYVGQVTPK